MNVRKIRIKRKILRQSEDRFIAHNLILPAALVVSKEHQKYYSRTSKTKKEDWTVLTVNEEIFRDSDRLAEIGKLKVKGHLYVYGKKSFGVDWDQVLDLLYSSPGDTCFYCGDTFQDEYGHSKKNKTKDHLIAREILKAYGYNVFPDNTVPCCTTCNGTKGSLDPYVWRVKLKTMIKANTKDKWRWKNALKVMNNILLKINDPKI